MGGGRVQASKRQVVLKGGGQRRPVQGTRGRYPNVPGTATAAATASCRGRARAESAAAGVVVVLLEVQAAKVAGHRRGKRHISSRFFKSHALKIFAEKSAGLHQRHVVALSLHPAAVAATVAPAVAVAIAAAVAVSPERKAARQCRIGNQC